MKIKVSVIIPAYNVENFISSCIESVLKQTLEEIEIIAIDDGSTDSTLKKLEFYKQNEKLKIFSKENTGLPATRNFGLNIASGEYIYHLDGDDWIEEETLMEMYEYAKKNNLDMVVADYFIEYRKGKKYKKELYNFDNILEFRKGIYEGKISWCVWNKLIKREIYEKVRFVEEISLGEDLLFISRAMYEVKRIGKINKAYCHYLQRKNSLTRDIDLENLLKKFLLLKELEKYLREKNIYENEKENLYRLAFHLTKTIIFNNINWSDVKATELLREYFEVINNPLFFKMLKKEKKLNKIILKVIYRFPNINIIKVLGANIRIIKKLKLYLISKIKGWY